MITGMKQKLLALVVLLICGVSAAKAQKISVESFNRIDRDMGARVAKVRDINSDLCALIKIETIETGFEFSGCIIEKTEQKTGEIWVFVSPGVRFLTIKHKEFGVLRNYNFPQSIESGVVYQMKLNTEGKEIKIDTTSIGKAVDSKLDEILQKRLQGMDLGTGAQPVVITMQQINDEGKTTNRHEYVDLGLSTKWAACNMGSASPEVLGNYYAWGETSPKRRYSVSNSTTYAVDMENIAADKNYDVARKQWGEPWRLPTTDELQKLIDSCSWQWATLNGMNGYKVTGPNGNSIFIPAAGLYNDMQVTDGGKTGNYWTSNSGSDSTIANCLQISNMAYSVVDSQRYYGMNIRPVLGNYNRYNFVTLNYAQAFVPALSSFGISVGTVKKYFGAYATVMTNFNFAGFAPDATVPTDQTMMNFYSGDKQTSRFSANAGVIVGKRGIYLKLGGGYGFANALWQLSDGRIAKMETDSYGGAELNAGAMMMINRWVLSLDVVQPISYIGEYLEARIGIGITF